MQRLLAFSQGHCDGSYPRPYATEVLMNIRSFVRRMMGGESKIVVLIAGDITGRVLTMIAWILIARKLGEAEFGLISWALAIVAYASIAADGGLAAFGARELARNPATEIAGAVRRLRLYLSTAVFALVVLIAWPLLDDKLFAVIVCTAAWLLPMSLNPEWILQGQHRIAAIGVLRFSLAVGLLGITGAWFVWLDAGAVMAGALRALAEAGIVIIAVVFGWTRIQTLTQTSSTTVALLRSSLPLAGATMLTGVYAANFDVLVLGYTRSDVEAGLYAAAFRIYLMTVVLPKLFLLPAYPRFAAARNPKALQLEIDSFVALVLRYGLLPPMLCGLLANELIVLLYGYAFEPAASVLPWLMVASVALLLNAPFPSALLACDRTRLVFIALSVALVISIGINLVATPRWGMTAAAIAVILAETTVLLVTHYFCRRELGVSLRLSSGFQALGAIAATVVGFFVREACRAQAIGHLATVTVVALIVGLTWAGTIWVVKPRASS